MLNKKVGAMILGVQKCGTTTLSHYLSQHPEINFCKQKEPEFFSKNIDWSTDLNNYHKLYASSKIINDKLWVEASTTYSWLLEYPEVPKRLLSYNNELKFIFILRDPVARIKSHYLHHRLKAYTKSTFEEEVLKNPTYIAHSKYATQIRPFLELFPKENFLFTTLERFKENSDRELSLIAEFLNISEEGFNSIDKRQKNKTADLKKTRAIKKTLTPLARLFPLKFRNALRKPFFYSANLDFEVKSEFEKYLWRFLEDDVRATEKITGLDLESKWKR
jgi:hypothetical protein